MQSRGWGGFGLGNYKAKGKINFNQFNMEMEITAKVEIIEVKPAILPALTKLYWKFYQGKEIWCLNFISKSDNNLDNQNTIYDYLNNNCILY